MTKKSSGRDGKSKSFFGSIMTGLIPFSDFKVFSDALSATTSLQKWAEKRIKIQEEIFILLDENNTGCDDETAAKNFKRVQELNDQLKKMNEK